MGWHFVHREQQAAIRKLISREFGVAIDYAVTTGAVWVVHRIQGRNYINCYWFRYLFKPTPGWWIRFDGESEGLELIHCPLRLLARAPVFSRAWRRDVRAYHRRRLLPAVRKAVST